MCKRILPSGCSKLEEGKHEPRELDLALLFPDCVTAQFEQENVDKDCVTAHLEQESVVSSVALGLDQIVASVVTAQEELDAQVQGYFSPGHSETVIEEFARSHTEVMRRSSSLNMQHDRLKEELGVQRQEMEARIAAQAINFQSLLDNRVADAVRELNAVISRRAEAVEEHANHVFATVEQRLDTFVTKLESLIARQSLDLKASQEESQERTSQELKKLEGAQASLQEACLNLKHRISDLDNRICSETERCLARMEEQFQSECANLGERASKSPGLLELVQKSVAQQLQEEKTLSGSPPQMESKFEDRFKDLEHKIQSGFESLQEEVESANVLAKTCLGVFDGPAASRLKELSNKVDKVKSCLHLQDVDIPRQDDQAECRPNQLAAQAWTQRRPQSARFSSSNQPHQSLPKRPLRPSSAKPEYGRPCPSIQSCSGAAKDDSLRLNAQKLLSDSVVPHLMKRFECAQAMQLQMRGGVRIFRPS